MREKLDLVFEIGTEDMPAQSVYAAIEQLETLIPALLDSRGLACGEFNVLATPRRIAALIKGIPPASKSTILKKKGPALSSAKSEDGNWTQAASGFAASQGVAVSDLVVEETDRGPYVFAVKEVPGEPALDILPGILEEIIRSIKFPKSMRWGNGDERFSRPVRWILAVADGKTVEVKFGDVTSSNYTYGHRYLSKGKITIADLLSYEELLSEQGVMVSHHERKLEIISRARQLCSAVNSNPLLDEAVLDEVVQLVERPAVLLGAFSEKYLSLPREVIIHVLQSHQRYFSVQGGDGSLKALFVVVHNGDEAYNDTIRKGHERVIAARLADADFFYHEDRKRKLSDRLAELEKVVYQSELGSMREKASRLQNLAYYLADTFSFSDATKERAARAALLSKCDLVTHMVVEFPDLQGVMGSIYALGDGEDERCAVAIFEQYLPRKSGDDFPKTEEGILLSLAEKIDNLAASFGLGHVPTGSEDPYALRRQVLGILTILTSVGLDLDVAQAVHRAAWAIEDEAHGFKWSASAMDAFSEFFRGRERVFFEEKGYRYDHVQAVLANYWSKPYRTLLLLKAIEKERLDGRLENLFTAFERCNNLSKGHAEDHLPRDFLSEPVEVELVRIIEDIEPGVKEDLDRADFEAAFERLASLCEPVDRLFDEVLIMDENERLRKARLSLLRRIVGLFEGVCDFSKLKWD